MRVKKSLCISIIALSIAACNSSSSDSKSAVIDNKYQGVWQASGYGTIYDIKENNINEYRFTTNYCFLESENSDITTSELEELIEISEDNTQFELFAGYGFDDFSAPGMLFTKKNSLPEACNNNLLKTLGEPGYQKNNEQELALFHEVFRDYYFDFETKDIDIDYLYQEAAENVSSDTTDLELANIMAEMVVPLSDTHIQIIDQDGIDFYTTTNKQTLPEKLVEEFAEFQGLPFPIPEELITQNILDDVNEYIGQMYDLQWSLVSDYAVTQSSIKTAENGLIRWFENEGIGYLYIGAMTGFAEESEDISDIEYAEQALNNLNNTLNLALNDLSQTQGLIVDVRTNGGGNDYISLAIASRFANASNTHVYSKQAREGDNRTDLVDVFISPTNETQYLSPVVVLTSANTVSGAEVFTLAMKQLDNVVIVGEPTQGSLSDILSFTLPSGIEVGLSNEFYLSPQGEWFEHVGVPVDVEVPFFTIEQREQDIDAGIETAYELLTQ